MVGRRYLIVEHRNHLFVPKESVSYDIGHFILLPVLVSSRWMVDAVGTKHIVLLDALDTIGKVADAVRRRSRKRAVIKHRDLKVPKPNLIVVGVVGGCTLSPRIVSRPFVSGIATTITRFAVGTLEIFLDALYVNALDKADMVGNIIGTAIAVLDGRSVPDIPISFVGHCALNALIPSSNFLRIGFFV